MSCVSSEHMIYHPEKLRVIDIISVLIFRRVLSSAKFIESHHFHEDKLGNNVALPNLITIVTLIIQKILDLVYYPIKWLGHTVEFTLNFFALNGGIFGWFFRLITGKLVIPNKESFEYRSFLGHIDGRLDLHKKPVSVDNTNEINVLDLCMMSAKVTYENAAYVKNAVTKHWKMHFVGFYDCWNEFQKTNSTQAFIYCDAPTNANMIVVAFRGTEAFNMKDWSTDVDLSWFSMGKLGRVHLGFMKALGLQNDKDYIKGWPKTYTGDKVLAYYTIRDQLNKLLEQNKGARILITGHSLGGALATLFPSLLVLHQEDTILKSIYGVYTFGQPRVGDKDFGAVMKENLNGTFKRYHRVVYRFDLVPRVPFDDRISQFAHFGDCLYFSSWYKGEVMKQEPNNNYFSPWYIIPKYFNAWLDLFRGIFAGIKLGKDYKEGFMSILFRMIGLLIPGVASHSPRDTVNSVRLAKITTTPIEDEEEVVFV
ncbi:hypothetical protein MKW94_026992 [Papaver nudicaule]|uniref:Fungal lipase-type domain-containing protein n=1 Tax=Papaver nudicaule TaxID=74823 RepID=A0AA42B2K8_PAPNU|nr:hypothetical protein [Papaver nudicaule]